MILLQNAAFLPMFRQAMCGRGKVGDQRLDDLQPEPLAEGNGGAINEIFADVSRDRMAAARKTLAWLDAHPDPQAFIDAARVLIFLKGSNAHDYKFSSAVLEDYRHVSPRYRGSFWRQACSTCGGRWGRIIGWWSARGRRWLEKRGQAVCVR